MINKKAHSDVIAIVQNELNKIGKHYEGTTIYDKDTTHDCKAQDDPYGHCEHESHRLKDAEGIPFDDDWIADEV